jgi:hypothetical protein
MKTSIPQLFNSIVKVRNQYLILGAVYEVTKQ